MLCPALHLLGHGYRTVRPQMVCGSDRPLPHPVLPVGRWEAFRSRAGRVQRTSPAPTAADWEVCVEGCKGISCLRGLFGARAVLSLSDALRPGPMYSGDGGLAFLSGSECQELGLAPCVGVCPLCRCLSFLSCSLLCNMGTRTVAAA